MAHVRGPLRFIAMLALVSGCSLGAVPGAGAGDGGADGGSGSGSSDDAAATAAFTSMITPIVTSATHNCAQAACHGGTQPPKLTSFAEFKASGIPAGKYMAKWDNNIINLKTATLGTPPMHQLLPWLDATELGTFMTFLNTYGQ